MLPEASDCEGTPCRRSALAQVHEIEAIVEDFGAAAARAVAAGFDGVEVPPPSEPLSLPREGRSQSRESRKSIDFHGKTMEMYGFS